MINNHKAPELCLQCTMAHEGINGRYCNVIKMYVEHVAAPPCK